MALERRKSGDVSLLCAWCASAWNRLDDVSSAAPGKTGVVIRDAEASSRLTMSRGGSFLMARRPPGWCLSCHHTREPVKKGKTQFCFVTLRIQSAIAPTRQLAGEV
jgi:hypothetical protein